MRRVFIATGLLSAVVFLFAIDKLGSRALITLVLSTNAPVKTAENFALKKSIQHQKAFPEDFLIGSASSSYQIEGGWDENGKTPSIWDDFVHYFPNVVVDNSTADIGCDSFHNYQEDVAALKLVGVRNKVE